MSLIANTQNLHGKILTEDQQAAGMDLAPLVFSDSAPADLIVQAAGLATRFLPVQCCLVWELLEGGKIISLIAQTGLNERADLHRQVPLDPDSLEGYTLAARRPIVMEDIRVETRFRSSPLVIEQGLVGGLSIPVGIPEDPLGVISVYSRQVHSFQEREIRSLQDIAHLAGILLHRKRQEEKREAEHRMLRKELAKAKSVTQSGHLEWDWYEIKNRMIESRERERLRLAQDLHDAPIQDLYGLIYQLDDLRDFLKNSEGEKIVDECNQMLHRVVDSLRATCRELRPPSLSPFGLEVAIRDHVEKFHDQNPDIQIHMDLMRDKQVLSDSLRLGLFRIYQQAIHNVARHAQASEVHIRFRWDEETITLEVKDNGRGFEVPRLWVELAREEHFGLIGVAERVESMRGKLDILSALGKGTLIRAIVPRS